MIATLDIQVTKAAQRKINEIDFNNLPFGKYFTDHMLEVDYADGEWKRVVIRPFQDLPLSPALAAIHYGQAIFEGIKAYKDREGQPFIFRPLDNFRRFNISAARMNMPVVPEEIFVEGMRRLVELDKDWIPMKNDYSLYIRPFLFATDEVIGVKSSETYKFMILLSPTGPYYSTPMRIYVEEDEPDATTELVDRLFPGLLQAIAMTELMIVEKWCEPPEVDRLHLSTLVQQVMSMIAEPSRVLRSRIRSRICAWIVTSSAVVGSSAISSFGLQASAMAIITR